MTTRTDSGGSRLPKLPVLPRSLRVGTLVVVAAGIVYFSLLDAPVPPTGPPVEWRDKQLHFAAYGALTVATAQATVEYRDRGWRRILGVVAFAVAFGIGIELAQWPLPMRYAAVDDVIANVAGTLLASSTFAVEAWLGYGTNSQTTTA